MPLAGTLSKTILSIYASLCNQDLASLQHCIIKIYSSHPGVLAQIYTKFLKNSTLIVNSSWKIWGKFWMGYHPFWRAYRLQKTKKTLFRL